MIGSIVRVRVVSRKVNLDQESRRTYFEVTFPGGARSSFSIWNAGPEIQVGDEVDYYVYSIDDNGQISGRVIASR